MNADSWAPFRYSTKRQEQVRLVWIAKNMIVLLALMILPVNAFSTTPSRTMHEGCQSQRSTTVSTTTTSLTANFLPFFSRDDDDNDKMELDEALEESTTNLVAGVFETSTRNFSTKCCNRELACHPKRKNDDSENSGIDLL